MSPRSIRTLLRTVHIILGVCVGAVIYLPAAWTEGLRLGLGLVVVPLIVITGVALWQQGRLRRLFSRRAVSARRLASDHGSSV